MNEREKATLIELIENEILKLGKDAAKLEEQVKPIAPDNAIGRLTRMEAINAKNMSAANLRNAKLRIAQLGKALERIDDEDFGVCVRCERPIPLKRIMLAPESQQCVRCMSR